MFMRCSTGDKTLSRGGDVHAKLLVDFYRHKIWWDDEWIRFGGDGGIGGRSMILEGEIVEGYSIWIMHKAHISIY